MSAVVKRDRQAGWVPPVIPFIQCGTLVCEMILLTFKEDLLAKVEQLWKYPRLMSVPKQRDSGKALNNPHFSSAKLSLGKSKSRLRDGED